MSPYFNMAEIKWKEKKRRLKQLNRRSFDLSISAVVGEHLKFLKQ